MGGSRLDTESLNSILLKQLHYTKVNWTTTTDPVSIIPPIYHGSMKFGHESFPQYVAKLALENERLERSLKREINSFNSL